MKKTTRGNTSNQLNKKNIEFTYSEQDITITYCKDYDPDLDTNTDKWGIQLPAVFLDEMSRESVYNHFNLQFSSLS